jgi:Tfp pilus assembly protein PilV
MIIHKSQLKSKKEEGFSLLEVVVSMLVATLFLLGLAQTMMLAAILNVRAQEKSQAVAWVEKEIETIRFLASNYTTGTCGTYGTNFQSSIIGSYPTTGTTYTFSAGTYNVTRTYTPVTNRLQIQYQISHGNTNVRKTSGNIVTTYAEVMPNGAYSCPP